MHTNGPERCRFCGRNGDGGPKGCHRCRARSAAYQVYTVIYDSPGTRGDGLMAVAVSASSSAAAKSRVTGNRNAQIIHVEIIEGRKPAYEQDRIEGTVDLADPLRPAPRPSAKAADDIRRRNKIEIRRRFPQFSKT